MNAEMSNNKKLSAINKRTVAVLSETEMVQVDGGTTVACVTYGVITSSQVCATAAGASVVVLYKIWEAL